MKIRKIEDLNNLKDFELKSLAKSIGHPTPGNKSNQELREYIKDNFDKVEELNNSNEGRPPKSIKKENWLSRNRTLVFFILSTILAIYLWRKTNIEKPMEFDVVDIPITLLHDPVNGTLISCSYFPIREIEPANFENYKESLNEIDKVFFNRSLKDIAVEKLKTSEEEQMNDSWTPEILFENFIHVTEYAFWWWMMDFPQSYYLLQQTDSPGVKTKKSGTLLPFDVELERRLPNNGNPLLKKNPPFFYFPDKSEITYNINQFEFKSDNSKLTFGIKSINGGKLDRETNDYVTFLYDRFRLNKEIEYNTVNIKYEISYKYIGSKFRKNSKTAKHERKWYKRIKKNAEADFSYDVLKEKLLNLKK
jgi:hypothetical protein